MGIASEDRGGAFTTQGGRHGVKTTGVTRLSHSPFVCSSVCGCGEGEGVCAHSGDQEWLRTGIFLGLSFPTVSTNQTLVQENSKRTLSFPNRTVHFVCGNNLHALRFRCERLIAYGYYGVWACTGITVIISGVHGKSKRSLRFPGCHFLRIFLSHNLELPHPQIGFCFLAECGHKWIFRHSY